MSPSKRLNFAHNPNSARAGFRQDIQGLRATAVLLVILFHAGIGIPGGFIGVDIFFVISGYVITTVILREFMRSNRVDWKSFFARRIRRLAPALGVLVLAVTLLSAFLLPPDGMHSIVAQTGIAALFLGANVVILANSGGYFDPAAELNPLLNTWSLSVEEQFYLVFPIVWVLALHVGRRYFRLSPKRALLFGFLLSASSSFGLMNSYLAGLSFPGSDTLFGFYGPGSRAWEFLVGCCLALVPAITSRLAGNIVASAGLAIILGSSFLLNSSVLWPSFQTIFPVLGTVLLLIQRGSWVSGLLSKSVLSRLGDWSYSLYLWHWPLIVFAHLIWPNSEFAKPLAAVFAILPALLSYYLVEQPLRTRGIELKKTLPRIVALFVITPSLVAVTLWGFVGPFLSDRLRNGGIAEFHAGNLDHHTVFERFFICDDNFMQIIEYDSRMSCHQSKDGEDVNIALLGDSHALRLFTGIAELVPQSTSAYFVHGGLPPVRSASPTMRKIVDYVQSSSSIETVVVAAWWQFYPNLDWGELERTVDSLTRAGKRVYLVEAVPTFPFHAYRCKYGVGGLVRIAPVCETPREVTETQRGDYLPKLEAIAERSESVSMLWTYDFFCNDEKCSMLEPGSELVLYQDEHHLGPEGSRFVVRNWLESSPQFRKAMTSGF